MTEETHTKPLVKPGKGWWRQIGAILIHANFARTWTWEIDDSNEKRRTHYFCVATVQSKDGLKLFEIILGPIILMFGKVK